MFDFKEINITEEEISFIEERFGFKFNEGQKRIIRFWDSTDIQACPGSGKTTTLAAKLIILAHKIPASFKQGVCIITHTNVAVEEIRRKLASYSSFYFSYPNHFGTIQSVVDKFFAIPAYKSEFKNSPTIDNDSFYGKIDSYNGKDIEKAKLYLSINKNIESLGNLSFNRINFDISDDINNSEPFVGVKTNTYQTLLKIKTEMLRDGFLKFEEAYSLAFKYIRENPKVKELFIKRFPLIFVDEMQDMESHQSELIQNLCSGTTAIVQKIGDRNQSIYNHSTYDKQIEWNPKNEFKLQLSETTRISDNIVKIVNNICLVPQIMTGWINTKPIKPKIIIFDDESILQVKDKFGELIIDNNLHLEKHPCKAIGARLSSSRLNLNSYWKEYNRGGRKQDFSKLNLFLDHIEQLSNGNNNVKEIRKNFLGIICKSLRLCNVRNPITNFFFTPFSLFRYLNSLDDLKVVQELNFNLIKWIKMSIETERLKTDIKSYILEFLKFFKVDNVLGLSDFFSDATIEEVNETSENQIYFYRKENQKVKIHFDTIHGVKGETHTATLYLETFTRTYDIGSKILDFIIATDDQKAKKRLDQSFKNRLSLAYVAMTRARQFICMAVHKDRYSEKHKKYFMKSDEWEVIDISKGC